MRWATHGRGAHSWLHEHGARPRVAPTAPSPSPCICALLRPSIHSGQVAADGQSVHRSTSQPVNRAMRCTRAVQFIAHLSARNVVARITSLTRSYLLSYGSRANLAACDWLHFLHRHQSARLRSRPPHFALPCNLSTAALGFAGEEVGTSR